MDSHPTAKKKITAYLEYYLFRIVLCLETGILSTACNPTVRMAIRARVYGTVAFRNGAFVAGAVLKGGLYDACQNRGTVKDIGTQRCRRCTIVSGAGIASNVEIKIIVIRHNTPSFHNIISGIFLFYNVIVPFIVRIF